MQQLESINDSASDLPSKIVKANLRASSGELEWSSRDVCRVVAREEAGRRESKFQPLSRAWRTRCCNGAQRERPTVGERRPP